MLLLKSSSNCLYLYHREWDTLYINTVSSIGTGLASIALKENYCRKSNSLSFMVMDIVSRNKIPQCVENYSFLLTKMNQFWKIIITTIHLHLNITWIQNTGFLTSWDSISWCSCWLLYTWQFLWFKFRKKLLPITCPNAI